MPITKISHNSWNEILSVQNSVYKEVPPEQLNVLKCKWETSPESCFVYNIDGTVCAYLLAHGWDRQSPPKLHTLLPDDTAGSSLFLHDLAVSPEVNGQGIGSKMVQHLITKAKSMGFTRIRLVSVQDSYSFWHKLGFTKVNSIEISPTYGDDAQMMELGLA
ncbi:GNAT family N-acetyltransferase [Vibrio sp.]|nr:GNAT family N-acetyltransferase [Vibrio sp.]